MTRAEAVTMFVRLLRKDVVVPDVSSISYTDVTGDWYTENVKIMSALGIVNGYEDGSFKPNQTIFRAEAVTVINRMLARCADEAYVNTHKEALNVFIDVSPAHWAYYSIMEVANAHTYTVSNDKENWK